VGIVVALHELVKSAIAELGFELIELVFADLDRGNWKAAEFLDPRPAAALPECTCQLRFGSSVRMANQQASRNMFRSLRVESARQ